jgi:omega-6 fatty acid desaturase (delta-12 desaturase)
MAQSSDRIAIPDAASLREVLARFQDPLPRVATWQIVTTILPLIALLVAMYVGLAFGWWPVLTLGVPAAALTVRTFIIQHDCGHGSFCRSRLANDLLGRFCSLLTLTPYAQWRRHHAKHHGDWNDLDRRNAHGRDLYSSCLTVTEYNALGTWRRLLHRTAKHPAISLLVLPPANFSDAVSLPVRRAARLARGTAQRAPHQRLAGCAPRHSRGDARAVPE